MQGAEPWPILPSRRSTSYSVRSFRNIESLELAPSQRFNVIAGDNGQGKTSVLEALYAVATSRSFRTELLREALRQGDEHATVRAEIREGGQQRTQHLGFSRTQRSLLCDGQKPDKLSDFVRLTPVVAFHPGDLVLVSGPGSVRRRLLDRLALFLDPTSSDARAKYKRAARDRQLVLERRGSNAQELHAFEQVLASSGARWSMARQRAAERLEQALLPAFSRMADERVSLEIQYRPGGSVSIDECLDQLRRRRVEDLRRHRVGFGPGRDELQLTLDGRGARKHGSQGQQRILALAVKLAELECVREARGAEPLLLLDDVSSELDPTRTGAVYEFLRQAKGQVFVTTTRPDLFETPGIGIDDRRDYRLEAGKLVV